MRQTSKLLMGLLAIAVSLVISMPCCVHAHGGIGGFHAGGVHAGGVHAGGVHAGGFHAGGVGHVGYYPHYHPGVGYYHPVARAAAWDAAYNGAGYIGGYNPYGNEGPYTSASAGVGENPTPSDTGDIKRAADAEEKLNAELKSDKDK